jgi:hypothetical protein
MFCYVGEDDDHHLFTPPDQHFNAFIWVLLQLDDQQRKGFLGVRESDNQNTFIESFLVSLCFPREKKKSNFRFCRNFRPKLFTYKRTELFFEKFANV